MATVHSCDLYGMNNILETLRDSLIEGVRQRLHGVDWHLAVVSCGELSSLPHVALPGVPYGHQVVLLEWQLFFIFIILLFPCEQCLCKKGSCREIGLRFELNNAPHRQVLMLPVSV